MAVTNVIDIGLRIKATEGDTGTIKGITYDDITLSGIDKYERSHDSRNPCRCEEKKANIYPGTVS